VLGCGHSFEAATPPGFVELEDQARYDYRATTADGLVIGIREIDHEPEGALDFWTRAIENQMRQRGGYALLGTRDVKSADGYTGKQLRFGHDEGNKPHLYSVTLFITRSSKFLIFGKSSKLLVIEAGGSKEQMEKNAQHIDWAIQNFHAK